MEKNQLSKVFEKLIEIEEKTGVVFEVPAEITYTYLSDEYTGSLTGKKVGEGQYYSVKCEFFLPEAL